MTNPHISPSEVKALFALVDAADEMGLLRNSAVEARWRQIKGDPDDRVFEGQGAFLWSVLESLDEANALAGIWIEARWRTIKKQVESSKALSRHPFF